MDKKSNMPLLDENKNSPVLEPPKTEKKELSVTSTTPGDENIAPKVIFEGITSPKSNISENNSNNAIQTKNILNTLASEIEVGGPVSDIHDASNGSCLGDAGVSFKSCNDSFSGEANNSFKSLNGSYVVENNSPKTTAVDECLSKIQSPLMLPNLNTSHNIANLGVSFDDGSSRDASFTKPSAESMVISPVVPFSENATRSALDTLAPQEFVTNESSISSSMVNDSISLNTSLPQIEIISKTNVLSDTFGDALAAFSSLKLNDTPARPTKSCEALLGDVKEAALMEFSMVQDAAASEIVSCQDAAVSETVSCQDSAVSEVVSHQDTAVSETVSCQDTVVSETENCQVPVKVDEATGNLPESAFFDGLSSNNSVASLSENVPQVGEVPQMPNSALSDGLNSINSVAILSADVPPSAKGSTCNEASPCKTESILNVPTAIDALCNSSDPLKVIEVEKVSTNESFTKVPGVLDALASGDNPDLESVASVGSPTKTISSEKMPEGLDAQTSSDNLNLKNNESVASPCKTSLSGNTHEVMEYTTCNITTDIDGKGVEAVKSPCKNDSYGTVPKASNAVCNEAETTLDAASLTTSVPEDSLIGNETFNLEAAKTMESPLKTCTATSLSETNMSGNHIDFKSTEGSPSIKAGPGKVFEASDHAISEDTVDVKFIENMMSPAKTEAKEKISEGLDNMFNSPLKTGSSISVPQTNICSEPIDFKSTEASPSRNKSSGNILEDTVEVKSIENFASPVKSEAKAKTSEGFDDLMSNNPFELNGAKVGMSFENDTFGKACKDPFDLKSLEEQSPVDDFIFKVPANPTITTTTEDEFKVPEDDEFTDAVQFFKDPSSFQFLENIQTSSSKEDNVPRSSLYIKFDPLHSAFPKNQDILQALKSENNDVNRQSLGMTARESLGNILISFDSPRKSGGQAAAPVIVTPAKVYTEEELQQLLNVNELTNQEILLKKQREMEEELARKEKSLLAQVETKDSQIAVLENHIGYLKAVLEDLADASLSFKSKQEDKLKKMKDQEDLITKLKDEVKTLTEDLQSVETTFSDFHKRYESSKSMLKTYKENEEVLKTQLTEQQQAYQRLQDSTREALEKASTEVASVKKTSEAQNAVLKAQLKKAEMKISGLESDMRQMKIENAQLGGICDDLMEKVGRS